MKRNRTISVILFVLGLGLVVLGAGLSDFSQTYLNTVGHYTTYPYTGIGAAIIIIGLAALSVAYVMIIRGETSSKMSEQIQTSRLRKGFLVIGIVLLVLAFFFFYWASRVNWDYVTTQEETVTVGYPSTVKNYGFGDSYVYPLNYFHNSGFFGLEIMIMHNDYLTVKCSSVDSQQAVYAVLVSLANDTAFSYGLGSLAYKSPSDYEWAGIYLAIPSNQSATNTTVSVMFTFNHYETPQWVIFGMGVALSSLAVIPIFKSKK